VQARERAERVLALQAEPITDCTARVETLEREGRSRGGRSM
jgi:hypothetical protein